MAATLATLDRKLRSLESEVDRLKALRPSRGGAGPKGAKGDDGRPGLNSANPLEPSVIGNLSDQIAAAAGRTLVLPAGNYTLDADVLTDVCTIRLQRGAVISVPVNRTLGCSLQFADGGQIVPASGVKATLTGRVRKPSDLYCFNVSLGGSFSFAPGAVQYLTPENFGAAADGVTDDLAAVTVCVNTAIDLAQGIPSHRVKLSSATYALSQVLPIYAGLGFRLQGVSRFASVLKRLAGGSTSTPVVKADRCQFSTLENLQVTTAATVSELVQVTQSDDGGSSAQVSSGFRVHSCLLDCRSLAVMGWQTVPNPTTDAKNDLHIIDGDTHIVDPVDACISIQGTQSLMNRFTDVRLRAPNSGDYGITNSRSAGHGGTFRGKNILFSGLRQADLQLGNWQEVCSIEGFYSEQGHRMIEALDGGGTYTGTAVGRMGLTIDGGRWISNDAAFAADGEWIQILFAGDVDIRINFGTGPSITPKIRWQPPLGVGSFMFRGYVSAAVRQSIWCAMVGESAGYYSLPGNVVEALPFRIDGGKFRPVYAEDWARIAA